MDSQRSSNKQAFTLLELIIVIIIVGILASLSLPKFFKIIEMSRSVEALANIKAIREAAERCALLSNGSFVPCYTWSALSLDDFDQSPNAHFTYVFDRCTWFGSTGYCIQATRNSLDNGDASGNTRILQRVDNVNRLYFCGYGVFAGLTDNKGPCMP